MKYKLMWCFLLDCNTLCQKQLWTFVLKIIVFCFFVFFLMFPACVAYRHWPHLQLVTSRPLITWLPTSALPLALDPTPYCCFCRTRSVSELFSTSLNISELMVKGCQGLNLCSQRFSGSFLDFITSVGKLARWVKRAAVPCVCVTHSSHSGVTMSLCITSPFTVPL